MKEHEQRRMGVSPCDETGQGISKAKAMARILRRSTTAENEHAHTDARKDLMLASSNEQY